MILGEEMYSIQYGVSDNTGLRIKRQNTYKNVIDVHSVINKVITCMVYFIKDIKPKIFMFSTKDSQLARIYGLTLDKVLRKDTFFSQYEILMDKVNISYDFKFIKR